MVESRETQRSHWSRAHARLRRYGGVIVALMCMLLTVYSSAHMPTATERSVYNADGCEREAGLPAQYCDPATCDLTEVICVDQNGEVMRYVSGGVT